MTQENKTKTAIVGVLTAVLILASFAGTANLPAAFSDTPASIAAQSEDSACIHEIADDMHAKAASLDSSKATSVSRAEPRYQDATQGLVSKFNSVYVTWNLDITNCRTSEIRTINVVHNVYDANGAYVKNVDVALDPLLTKILNVTEYVAPSFSVSESNVIWAGYELTGNSFTWPSPPATNVWEAYATWNIPAVSVPSNPSTACRTDTGHQKCDLAVWDGLQDKFHAADDNNLAQAGTDGVIDCHPSCITSYFMWYEFLPSLANLCTGLNTLAGDSIRSIVTSHGKTGGTTTLYDISLLDLRNITGCSTTSHSYAQMSSPKIATFVNERAASSGINCPCNTVAQFSSDTITGQMYYSGSSKSIQTPHDSGWYDYVYMLNSGNTNICTVPSGSSTCTDAMSSGSFIEKWKTSAGT